MAASVYWILPLAPKSHFHCPLWKILTCLRCSLLKHEKEDQKLLSLFLPFLTVLR